MHDDVLCFHVGMLCMNVGMVCSINVRNIVHVKFDTDHPP